MFRTAAVGIAVLLVAAMLAAGSVPALALNQIVNGSFEEGVVGFWRNPSDQPLPPPWNWWDAGYPDHPAGLWNINVDGHDNVPATAPPDGFHCASVCAGMNWSSGGIWQEVDVTPGMTFNLSGWFHAGDGWHESTVVEAQFWLFNSAPSFDELTGDLITTGGVAALDYTGPRTSGWTSFSGGGLTATGSTIYVVSRFNVTDPWSAYGMHMDDLVLEASPAGPLPEPSGLVSLAGLVGLAGLVRRRR